MIGGLIAVLCHAGCGAGEVSSSGAPFDGPGQTTVLVANRPVSCVGDECFCKLCGAKGKVSGCCWRCFAR